MMAKQVPKRKSLRELMKSGGGLQGFSWPEGTQDFGIAIRRDGTWTHRGDPIHREKLVQLFATILQRDAVGKYWLVTPVEKGRVDVEDAPFTAVEMRIEGAGTAECILHFRTNLGYWVAAGPNNALRVEEEPATGEPSPYIHIRDGLDALIARAVFYDLVALAEECDGALTVTSGGVTFVLGRIE